ncbi:ComEC family competence protein [Mucilaginibacter daejeonensis]|uniref:ComEC/Rec2 family competence protein n=1 Tax=Mucilaginibacter daejeonensis TaxID=398049 RepID=UPI001D1716E5|nr:ComEC/Rec2 family competence protein [Mucilaginibacter daejeonensis]UEG51753.1 ComEC family competence protein [Mucilaginibacter daejeonensis]
MLRIQKSEIPLFYWLLPFVAGIILGLWPVSPNVDSFVEATLLISAVLFLGSGLLYDTAKLHRWPWIGGLLLNILLISGGWYVMRQHDQLSSTDHFSRTNAAYMIVRITDEPRQKGIYTRMVAQVQATVDPRTIQHPATGKMLLTLAADSNSHLLRYGDQLVIPAIYKPIDPPFNPAEFNYKRYLAHQNIYHQAFITRTGLRIIEHDTGNPMVAFALNMRQRLVRSMKMYIHDQQAAAIASTLLLGYKADLSEDVLQAYSKTGTIHVLSVSGAHVAIFFVLISFLLRPFKHHRYGKLLNAVLSVTLVWAYAILTGLSPAVCRAALMLSMLIIGKAGSRQVHALNMLGFSAFVLLVYDPLLITDVGFQLSYLAVFGLVAVQPVIADPWEVENKWLKKLWYLCSASLAAQLVTFPLSIYYFHQFPVYFLISNLLIILPSEAIMMVGLAFLLTTFFPAIHTLSGWLAYLLEHLILFMNAILSYIEHLPFASWGKLWLNGAEHLLLYLVITLLIVYITYRRPYQLLSGVACLLVLCTSLSWKAINSQQHDQLIYLNLKKNTGIIFKTRDQAVVVSDLLPTDKKFNYSIRPCLDSLGVERMTAVPLSADLKTTYLQKRGPLIQFQKRTLLLIEPLLQKMVIANKLTVNDILLTHNPHTDIAPLLRNYRFERLIADANTSKQRSERLKHQADSAGVNLFLLRRNKALITLSKE